MSQPIKFRTYVAAYKIYPKKWGIKPQISSNLTWVIVGWHIYESAYILWVSVRNNIWPRCSEARSESFDVFNLTQHQ